MSRPLGPAGTATQRRVFNLMYYGADLGTLNFRAQLHGREINLQNSGTPTGYFWLIQVPTGITVDTFGWKSQSAGAGTDLGLMIDSVLDTTLNLDAADGLITGLARDVDNGEIMQLEYRASPAPRDISGVFSFIRR